MYCIKFSVLQKTRPDLNERQEAAEKHFAAIESAIQALAEQTAAEQAAYLARHTSFMNNPISEIVNQPKLFNN